VFPKVVYDKQSGFDPKQFKNTWGVCIPSIGGPGNVQFASPPPLPGDAFQMMATLRGNIEYVSAINDVSQGRRPASVTSGEAISRLQEAAKTVIRPKARLWERALVKLGKIIIDLIQYGYTEPRMMRIIGMDGQTEDIQLNTPYTQNIQNDEGGLVMAVEKVKNDMTIGEYDVMVEPDSTLPQSGIERFGRLIDLSKMGMADRKAILQNSGLDDWQEIDQRIQAKEDELRAKQEQERAMAMQQNMAQRGPQGLPA
jgi:hypothetical protein